MENLISLKESIVIYVVGSGGKTTLIKYIANKFRNKKVLITTTTKIKIPKKEEYKYIAFNIEEARKLAELKENGIYVFGEKFNTEKLGALPKDFIEGIGKNFDIVLVEADGAKEKLIKAWNNREPVILDNADMTIGIVNVKAVGLEINDENIHRLDEFLKVTKGKADEYITKEHIESLISSEDGLFKNAKGKKILLINGAHSSEKLEIASSIKGYIESRNKSIDLVVIGDEKWRARP